MTKSTLQLTASSFFDTIFLQNDTICLMPSCVYRKRSQSSIFIAGGINIKEELIEFIRKSRNPKEDPFDKQNVSGMYDTGCYFRKLNIVIGANGAGKSRFLKGVRDYFATDNQYLVLYFNFTDINQKIKECGMNTNAAADGIEPTGRDISHYLNIRLHGGTEPYIDGIACAIKNASHILHMLIGMPGLEMYMGTSLHSLREQLKHALEPLGRYARFRNMYHWGFERRYTERPTEYAEEETMAVETAVENMSSGERVLFYYAISLLLIEEAIHKTSVQKTTEPAGDIKKVVLLMDEPDNHLHTKAFIELLTRIVSLKDSSDILHSCWISTQSLFALPQFEYKEIVYIRDGLIRMRKTHDEIFKDLVGEDLSVAQMHYGMNTWQYFSYIAECCLPPDVLLTSEPTDPQYKQFQDYFNREVDGKSELSVLDFGGGEGRLWSIIQKAHGTEYALVDYDKLRYMVYDNYTEQPEEHKNAYRHIRGLEELIEPHTQFNCVVMMNVLHEISIVEWLAIFRWVAYLLRDDGHLILGEATVLTRGEQPYTDNGFLLLGAEQIKDMFAGDKPIVSLPLGENPSKVIAFQIPKSNVAALTWKKIYQALHSLRRSEYIEVKNQHTENKDRAKKHFLENPGTKFEVKMALPFSRKYAFISQRYQNACLAIDKCHEYFIEEYLFHFPKSKNGFSDAFWLDEEKSKRSFTQSFDDLERMNSNKRFLKKVMLYDKAIHLLPRVSDFYYYRAKIATEKILFRKANPEEYISDQTDEQIFAMAVTDAAMALANAKAIGEARLELYYILLSECYKNTGNYIKACKYFKKIPEGERTDDIWKFLKSHAAGAAVSD